MPEENGNGKNGNRVGLLQRSAAVTERLHLGAGEHDTRLVPLEQVVIVPRLAVLGDELDGHWRRLEPPAR